MKKLNLLLAKNLTGGRLFCHYSSNKTGRKFKSYSCVSCYTILHRLAFCCMVSSRKKRSSYHLLRTMFVSCSDFSEAGTKQVRSRYEGDTKQVERKEVLINWIYLASLKNK